MSLLTNIMSIFLTLTFSVAASSQGPTCESLFSKNPVASRATNQIISLLDEVSKTKPDLLNRIAQNSLEQKELLTNISAIDLQSVLFIKAITELKKNSDIDWSEVSNWLKNFVQKNNLSLKEREVAHAETAIRVSPHVEHVYTFDPNFKPERMILAPSPEGPTAFMVDKDGKNLALLNPRTQEIHEWSIPVEIIPHGTTWFEESDKNQWGLFQLKESPGEFALLNLTQMKFVGLRPGQANQRLYDSHLIVFRDPSGTRRYVDVSYSFSILVNAVFDENAKPDSTDFSLYLGSQFTSNGRWAFDRPVLGLNAQSSRASEETLQKIGPFLSKYGILYAVSRTRTLFKQNNKLYALGSRSESPNINDTLTELEIDANQFLNDHHFNQDIGDLAGEEVMKLENSAQSQFLEIFEENGQVYTVYKNEFQKTIDVINLTARETQFTVSHTSNLQMRSDEESRYHESERRQIFSYLGKHYLYTHYRGKIRVYNATTGQLWADIAVQKEDVASEMMLMQNNDAPKLMFLDKEGRAIQISLVGTDAQVSPR